MRQALLLTGGFVLFAAAHAACTQTGDSSSLGNPAATRALFNQLDANGDGYRWEAEAGAAQPIADRYDSMDTNATLEKQAKHGNQGIDYAQFKAGIEAARSGGAFGPSVSGGPTYLVYPDGHRELIKSGPETPGGGTDPGGS